MIIKKEAYDGFYHTYTVWADDGKCIGWQRLQECYLPTEEQRIACVKSYFTKRKGTTKL